MQEHPDTPRTHVSVAVRRLAETARRQGGLAAPLSGGLTGLEGTRLHQAFIERAPALYPGTRLMSERTMQTEASSPTWPFDLTVQGRLDLLSIDDRGRMTLIELKGFRGSPVTLPREGDPVHLAQARLYAWMLAHDDELKRTFDVDTHTIDLELRYISFDDRSSHTVRETWTRERLEDEAFGLCDRYVDQMAAWHQHRLRRDEQNRAATFPYPELREGQATMMREVIAAIRDHAVMFVTAPTGIGKTMATLYPSLKAQAHGWTDQIFYLTPTRSQRTIAEVALDDLEREGFWIRSLTVHAKEQLCLSPEHFCNTKTCPYAIRYYEHLDDARKTSLQKHRLLPDDMRALGRHYQLCPFALSLDLLDTVDVVICDYNYVFNPRVRWNERLDDPKVRYTLLIDEAHNLARRSREMFSAAFARGALVAMQKALPHNRDREAAVKTLQTLIDVLDRYRTLIEAETLEGEALKVMDTLRGLHPVRHINFLATKTPPEDLMRAVLGAVGFFTGYFMQYTEFPGREAMMPTYFDLVFFTRVSERYYNDAYITAWRVDPKGTDVYVSLLALDASSHLTDIYYGRSPVVFFSATLSPMPYYMALLDARHTYDRPEVVHLPSPFDRDRRLVVAFEQYSTRYRDRPLTLPNIATLIEGVVAKRRGHYLVFCPSFAYAHQLVRAWPDKEHLPFELLVQPPRMSERQKQAYLKRFNEVKPDRSLVGITVIGSLFNEGIDLVGDALNGVMIIGTGLPGLSPERDLLRQYYDAKATSGFDYAYRFPGFNRIMQAAGRLIRSEDDYGIVVLIDDRYGTPEYRALLPDRWNVYHTDDAADGLAAIEAFWERFDPPPPM
ncbi:MAG: ATP-dependent DNA helicase [Saccharofermentanales bacterium]